MLEEGFNPSQILDSLPFSYRRYERDIRAKFFALRGKETPPKRNVSVIWHVGESGTGKSYTYTELCKQHGEEDVYLLTDYETGVLSGKLNDAPSGRLFRADFRTLQMCQSL